MTLANQVTIFRLLLLPAILFFLAYDFQLIGFGLFLFALGTDWLDGVLAREREEVTQLGEMLDPFADKMLFMSLFAYFSYIDLISVYAFAALLIPHLFLIIGGAVMFEAQGRIISAKAWGKVSSFVLSFGIMLVFFQVPYYKPVLYAGVGLAYAAATYYILFATRLLKNRDGEGNE